MGSARTYLPSLLGAMGVAVALTLSTASIVELARPVLIAAVVGFAGIAVAASLFWSMGLARESIGLRCMAAVPILLSILLVVALMLDADFRGRAGGVGG